MTPVKLALGAASLLCLLAASIAFWPVARHNLPTPYHTVASFELIAENAANAFDRSHLPAHKPKPKKPVALTPPPDPAAALKRFQYLGMASSDREAAGIFSADGKTRVLRRGDALEGFSIIALNANEAVFNIQGDQFIMKLRKIQN